MRRPLLLAALLLGSLVLSGCVSMPTSGPVTESGTEGDVSSSSGTFLNPKPPQPGATRSDIVRGFLVAMTAIPIQPNTAREFLSKDAAAAWDPENETITYVDYPPLKESAEGVTVTLTDPDRLDAQGAWQGPLPRGQRTIRFPMSFEDGEWRIDAAPDALIVPETWFARQFRQVSLYYFDPTGTILAPEPVYVPRGVQLASSLTQALIAGPGEGLDRVVQSFIPAGLKINLSVRVSRDGVAEIGLKGDAGALTPQTVELMLVQLAWTLRQEPQIQALRITLNDDPVPLPGGVSAYPVNGDARYDPSGYQAASVLFGLRGGRLSSGTSGTLAPVSGPFGATVYGLRSVAVNLSGARAAGVTTDGRSVLVAPVSAKDGGTVRRVVSRESNLLTPAWDSTDNLWLVDRTARGAAVSTVRDGRVKAVAVPGVTGESVRSFVVSRDGTRLVATVHRSTGDRLVVSRIAHDRTGRVLWATQARPIGSESESDLPVQAIAWRTPTALAILSPFTTSLSQLRTAAIDGSPAAEGSSTTVEGRLRALAGSPVADEPVYGITPRSLVDVFSPSRASIPLGDDTTQVRYAG